MLINSASRRAFPMSAGVPRLEGVRSVGAQAIGADGADALQENGNGDLRRNAKVQIYAGDRTESSYAVGGAVHARVCGTTERGRRMHGADRRASVRILARCQ